MIWYLSDSFFLDKIKSFLSISNVPHTSPNRMIHRLDKNQRNMRRNKKPAKLRSTKRRYTPKDLNIIIYQNDI